MSETVVGMYWARNVISSPLMTEVRYSVLWLFPSGRFRYVFCWPGYTWMTASGEWLSVNDAIHCQGTSGSFTDDLSDNHSNRPYTAVFTHDPDEQTIVSVGSRPTELTRLSSDQLGRTFRLEEQRVPTHWTDFEVLMGGIEKQLGISRKWIGSFLKERGTPD